MAYLCSAAEIRALTLHFFLYSTLVRPLFYRFIEGRPNESPDSSYELATRSCTVSVTSWVRRLRRAYSCHTNSIIDVLCAHTGFYLPATLNKLHMDVHQWVESTLLTDN